LFVYLAIFVVYLAKPLSNINPSFYKSKIEAQN